MTGSRRVEVLGGTGTVCRDGAVVGWFAPGFSLELATEVLEVARSTAPEAGASGLAQALEGALGANIEASVSAFGIVVEGDGALAVAIKGHVVVSEDGLERLRGTVSKGPVSVDLVTTASVTVRGGSDGDQLDRPGSLPFDLREGTVPGGGVTFWASEHSQPFEAPQLDDKVVLFDLSVPATPRQPLPVAPPSLPVAPSLAVSAPPSEHDAPPSGPVETMPEPEVGAPVAEVAGSNQVAGSNEPTEVAEAQAVASQARRTVASQPATSAPSSAPASEHPHLVRGITCARGHFNNPRALYCGICGIAMVQNSIVLVDGLRPPLGVLLSDTGMAYSLDSDYVLGREPERAADVAAGRARPLRLDDGTGKISRVHARVSLQDWDVVITDLKSHNGTSVFNPGETNWRRLQADEAVVLQPGGRLVIGQSTFEFQSIQRH